MARDGGQGVEFGGPAGGTDGRQVLVADVGARPGASSLATSRPAVVEPDKPPARESPLSGRRAPHGVGGGGGEEGRCGHEHDRCSRRQPGCPSEDEADGHRARAQTD